MVTSSFWSLVQVTVGSNFEKSFAFTCAFCGEVCEMAKPVCHIITLIFIFFGYALAFVFFIAFNIGGSFPVDTGLAFATK